jgi:hypothetical protein
MSSDHLRRCDFVPTLEKSSDKSDALPISSALQRPFRVAHDFTCCNIRIEICALHRKIVPKIGSGGDEEQNWVYKLRPNATVLGAKSRLLVKYAVHLRAVRATFRPSAQDRCLLLVTKLGRFRLHHGL